MDKRKPKKMPDLEGFVQLLAQHDLPNPDDLADMPIETVRIVKEAAYKLLSEGRFIEAVHTVRPNSGLSYAEAVWNIFCSNGIRTFPKPVPNGDIMYTPFSNGVYNHYTNSLMAYESCKDMLFTTIPDIAYKEDAVDHVEYIPELDMEFGVDSWLYGLSGGSPAVERALLLTVQAALRPHMGGNRIICFITDDSSDRLYLCSFMSILTGMFFHGQSLSVSIDQLMKSKASLKNLQNVIYLCGVLPPAEAYNLEECTRFKSLALGRPISVDTDAGRQSVPFQGMGMFMSIGYPGVTYGSDLYKNMIFIHPHTLFPKRDEKFLMAMTDRMIECLMKNDGFGYLIKRAMQTRPLLRDWNAFPKNVGQRDADLHYQSLLDKKE